MIWSSVGFMVTNLLQATAPSQGIAILYLADVIDGCTSCMSPLCQAYVTDCSPPDQLATKLGLFQGVSVAAAFIIAFPVGGILGAKYGPRLPLFIAAGVQALNALIILLFTPESNVNRDLSTKINWKEANPWGGLVRLFGQTSALTSISTIYFLGSLARMSLDAQFVNFSSLRFGWTQAQSGPVLVLVGLIMAIAPRLLVSRLGGALPASMVGLAIFTIGLFACGSAPTPLGFVLSILVIAVGSGVALPSLQALLVTIAPGNQRGALLGAVGSILELTGAFGSTFYAQVLSYASTKAQSLLGMHFWLASFFSASAFALTLNHQRRQSFSE